GSLKPIRASVVAMCFSSLYRVDTYRRPGLVRMLRAVDGAVESARGTTGERRWYRRVGRRGTPPVRRCTARARPVHWVGVEAALRYRDGGFHGVGADPACPDGVRRPAGRRGPPRPSPAAS